MSLPECTVYTNNIQNLPDSPTLSSDQLKQEFDKTGKEIKEYVNEILIPAIEKLVKEEKDNLEISINNKIQKKYPVGYIIMSTTNTNPNTYLGFGKWIEWGSGKVPVGVKSDETEFNSVEKTGGSKTVSLQPENLPEHHHSISLTTGNQSAGHTHSLTTGKSNSVSANGQFGISGAVLTNTNTAPPVVDASGVFTTNSSDRTGCWAVSSVEEKRPANRIKFSYSHSHNLTGNTGSQSTNHTHNVTGNTGNIGKGNPYNNLQPYITCYMWKRIS